ncbi:MAG: 16S rRNA (guanine(966)-N(2))-methyltransferase RsmD [Candidatus Tenebribacter burtonii]|jgi:16S rRNA (guanine966-N2)-methyltransferase|nr:16S rRNA (guanine(966)-N(2))-methyltransferase RsmD [Candidatus Tenebribacter burtonii]
MRIITGKFKKANLFTVPGKTARPTTDYIKEVIFSVISSCNGKNVLDLYAGSGSLGFEALSRNADFVDFVDFSDKSIKTMKHNIEKLKCTFDCKIHKKKVSAFLNSIDKKFDLIFIDPPYDKDLVNFTIEKIIDNLLLSQNGHIVIEHSPREKLLEKWNVMTTYNKNYGSSVITVLTNENLQA